MEWDYFECFVGALWLKRGFKSVYKTPAHDDGVDIVALNGKTGALIQCKTSSIDGHQLGWDGIKDVVTGQAAHARRHPGVSLIKVCVTNQFFNGTARKHAEMNDVETVDQHNLERLLENPRSTQARRRDATVRGLG
jgi:Holliday junction resolvase